MSTSSANSYSMGRETEETTGKKVQGPAIKTEDILGKIHSGEDDCVTTAISL